MTNNITVYFVVKKAPTGGGVMRLFEHRLSCSGASSSR